MCQTTRSPTFRRDGDYGSADEKATDALESLLRLGDRAAARISKLVRKEPDDAEFLFYKLLRTCHGNALTFGAGLVGASVTDEDRWAVAQAVADGESYHFRRFLNAVEEDPDTWTDDRIHRRMRMYLGLPQGTAYAGMVEYSPPETEWEWELGSSADHCEDCVFYAENGPFTRDILPTYPRSNRTACLFNCECHLSIVGGATGPGPVSFAPIGDVKPLAFKHPLLDGDAPTFDLAGFGTVFVL